LDTPARWATSTMVARRGRAARRWASVTAVTPGYQIGLGRRGQGAHHRPSNLPVGFFVVHAFTPDQARGLDGPFADERAAAAERAAVADWPSPTEEIWRYSRIDELDLERFAIGKAETRVEAGEAGAYVATDERDLSSFPSIVDGDAPDVFADLNAAFFSPVVVTVPAGTVIEQPIVIERHVSDGATFPRLVIDVGEDAEVVVVERHSSVDAAVLVVPVVHVRAGRAARVKYLGVNELSDQAWQIGHLQADGDADSSTTLSTVALGGRYARLRTEARITGRGGSTKQTALYFAGGEQMHDFRTIQDHAAPHTTSDLLFKGAVQDVSASVYTGLIRIRPDARGSVAFQTNRNLTLGAGAWASSVPNLEIEANDVHCSHASTVGPIDDEQRFYLESRGVPTHIAERLIVLGFFDEVISQLPLPSLAVELRARVADKLDLGQPAVSVGGARRSQNGAR
jgi:Fe-S cluster assembly protein SufD